MLARTMTDTNAAATKSDANVTINPLPMRRLRRFHANQTKARTPSTIK